MSPAEIRGIREGLRLSRRAFVPKLLISESTLVRWERGDTEPSEAHVSILRRMQQYLSTARPSSGVQYDPGLVPSAADGTREEKDVVVGALKEIGIHLIKEKWAEDSHDWWLTFDPRWVVKDAPKLSLTCSGTKDATWPFLSLELCATMENATSRDLIDKARHAAFDHALGFEAAAGSGKRAKLRFSYRLFTTGFNSDTVKHVIGNFASCWRRVGKTSVALPPEHSGAGMDGRGKASR